MTEQRSLWDPTDVDGAELLPVDGSVRYFRDVFAPGEADQLLDAVLQEVDFVQEYIVMFGNRSPVPRLSAWHGEPGRTYTYSGITQSPRPWTPALDDIRARIEPICRAQFNSVLVNLYRDGSDGVAWHSDDEPELGPEPIIGSVSLGDTRRFVLRHRSTGERVELTPAPGSLIVMAGPTQQAWEHQVPKTARPAGPRINLTFRHST